MIYKYIFPFISISVLFGQFQKSIHQIELEWHKTHTPEPVYKPYSEPAIPLRPRIGGPSKTIFGYHPYWQGTKWQHYNYDLLSTIAYFSAEADADGSLINLHGWPATDLINKAHENGVKVVLATTLFSSSKIETLLSNSTYRQNLIDNLLYEVKRAGADGVNIDFESFPTSQKTNMVSFVKALVKSFHGSIPGSEVTLAMPAVDWNSAWDINELSIASDGLFIMGYDYHWKGSSTTGPVAPLTGGSYNVTNSVSTYLSNTNQQSDKIILGVPYYGYEWGSDSGNPGANTTRNGDAVVFSTAESKALSYGKQWHTESQTPWYRYQNPGWFQGWYDDKESLSKKYDLAMDKNLLGVGIWALGYDSGYTELWELLKNKFSNIETPPTTPHSIAMTNMGNGFALIDYKGAETADSIIVYRTFLNNSTINILGKFTSNPIVLQSLNSDEPYFLKLQAVNAYGISEESELLGFVPTLKKPDVLIVNGFDRLTGTTNTFDFIRQHGAAIHNAELTFDGVSNEAIINGSVDLNHYKIVDWILGEEGTATHSFDQVEQKAVIGYLENGGKLIISGSEVGYDLSEKGDIKDQEFYNNYLKASFISDAAAGKQGTYATSGVSGTFLDGFSFQFDNGSHGTYDVDWPDGIKPVEGAENILTYTGADYNANGGAGISYRGGFGPSYILGALVYLSVGFETIYPEDSRNTLMTKILDYLRGPKTNVTNGINPLPTDLGISAIYPNPSNSRVTIEFTIPAFSSSAILSITNIQGREVFSMPVHPLKAKTQLVHWNGSLNSGGNAPSGVYVAILKNGTTSLTKKFTLLK